MLSVEEMSPPRLNLTRTTQSGPCCRRRRRDFHLRSSSHQSVSGEGRQPAFFYNDDLPNILLFREQAMIYDER
jgi:hypothetical protein